MTIQAVDIFTEIDGSALTVARYYPHRNGGTLEYAQEWLNHPFSYALSPAVPLTRGKQPLIAERGYLPTVLSDSAPDRWGRMLIQKEHASRGQQPAEIDYLLGVADRFRLGALRMRVDGVVQSRTSRVPKVLELDQLERAARAVEQGDEGIEALARVAQAGSSLGGARPKATVVDEDGRLLMAKFSSASDTIELVAWEKVCLDIAAAAGVNVPTSRLIRINSRPVLLLERFDRSYDDHGNETRIPYMSAMTLLNLTDGQQASMVEIAEAIQPLAGDVQETLSELFLRTAVNLFIGNTDNHLRNHGFVRVDNEWRPSPAFDLTPATSKTDFATPIDLGAPDNVDTLIEAADWFELDQGRAVELLAGVVEAVSVWRDLARKHGIPTSDDRLIAAGFESEHLERAREILA